MAKNKPQYSKEVYRGIAEIYNIMSNPKRLEILNLISEKEVTVNELSKALETRKSNTSQHLAYLRYTGFVTSRRQGKNIFYKISDPRIIEPCKIYKELWEKKGIAGNSSVI